ncbi:hypothetical protein [Actinomadura sp. SCN-SB]|uniref:hypothetical protein n=1 Tax=Actinomadura sp. SCN-SB TaxID=3373092 RepID=UPI0037539DF2
MTDDVTHNGNTASATINAAWTHDPDPLIAARAAELLVRFPATRPRLSRLMGIPEAEGHEMARASANLSLGHLTPGEPAIDNRLTALLAARARGVRLTAAVALALRLGDRLPDAALRRLAEARDHAEEINATAFPIPRNRPLPGFAASALYRIGLSP